MKWPRHGHDRPFKKVPPLSLELHPSMTFITYTAGQKTSGCQKFSESDVLSAGFQDPLDAGKFPCGIQRFAYVSGSRRTFCYGCDVWSRPVSSGYPDVAPLDSEDLWLPDRNLIPAGSRREIVAQCRGGLSGNLQTPKAGTFMPGAPTMLPAVLAS